MKHHHTALPYIIALSTVLLSIRTTVHADTDWVPVLAAICDATNAPITTKGLGALCKVAKELPSEENEVRQTIYKMVCAGLASIGDMTNFEKVYAQVSDRDENETDLSSSEFGRGRPTRRVGRDAPRSRRSRKGFDYRTKCSRCNGTGYSEKICPVCGGGGRCPSCHGEGESRRPGLAGAGDIVMPCGRCGRSGKCDRCKGKGRVNIKCDVCSGIGGSISVDRAKETFQQLADDLLSYLEEKAMASQGLYRYDDEWVTQDELHRRQERDQKEREEQEARDRKEREEREARIREMVERMHEKGLEYIDGEWMTPGSLRRMRYRIFQIYEPGHALCEFIGTDIIFCLLYSAKDNPNLAEGDRLVNDLYRCGTYSYTTVQNAPRTVRMYAIDLEVALREIERQR